MEYAKIAFRTVRQIPYPTKVYHLKTAVLILSETFTSKFLKSKRPTVYKNTTRIRSLTKAQHKLVMYVGKHRNDIPSWEAGTKVMLANELLRSGMRYNVKHKTIHVEGIKIRLDQINLIGLSKNISSSKTRYIKRRTNGAGVLYYYNYGGEHFDYYGTGLQEAQAAWKTILQVISCDSHFVIFTTVKKDNSKIKQKSIASEVDTVKEEIGDRYHRLN